MTPTDTITRRAEQAAKQVEHLVNEGHTPAEIAAFMQLMACEAPDPTDHLPPCEQDT